MGPTTSAVRISALGIFGEDREGRHTATFYAQANQTCASRHVQKGLETRDSKVQYSHILWKCLLLLLLW